MADLTIGLALGLSDGYGQLLPERPQYLARTCGPVARALTRAGGVIRIAAKLKWEKILVSYGEFGWNPLPLSMQRAVSGSGA